MRKRMFRKDELISLVIILLVLIGVSVPNFMASLRRSRDQVRRDDLGSIVHAVDNFHEYFGVYPSSSTDGKIIDCLGPNSTIPHRDESGVWIFDLISCEWGKDSLDNLVTGDKYLTILPNDPKWQEGINYLYKSDGRRFQIFAFMEGKNEAEVDPKIIEMNLSCGSKICNVGRSYDCDFPKSIEQCTEETLAVQK